MLKALVWIGAAVALVAVGVLVAFQVSPWPGAMLIRRAFDEGARHTSEALQKHVPAGIGATLDVSYDPGDAAARLDVYFPEGRLGPDGALPTVVWVHGGGWVSGSKAQIGEYARILADKGFTVVSVDYSIAPESTYPMPVRQVNRALAFLAEQGAQLHVDGSRMFLAGDSGGAHIAAQVANVVAVPDYAAAMGISPGIDPDQLIGILLFCGAYDMALADLDGPFGSFIRTVLWAYSGSKGFQDDPAFKTASIVDYVTAAFPPAFISVGNADPLKPHSTELARKLDDVGASVETLFFPDDYQPQLQHEYQFDLDLAAAQEALTRAVAFLRARAGE